MARKGSSQEEEDFRRALNKTDVGGALRSWVPMLAAGAVGLGTLVAVSTFWPFTSIPVLVLLGVPLAAGAGAFIGLQKLMG